MSRGVWVQGCGMLAALFVLVIVPAFADDLGVEAKVDRTEVAAGEILTFAVTIEGAIQEPPKVQLASFEGFDVVATGQSQQIRIEAGQPQQALVLTYSLAPTTVGTHTLGPVKVEYKGRVYETQPIEVKVVRGSPNPKRRPALRSQPPRAPKAPKLEGGVIL